MVKYSIVLLVALVGVVAAIPQRNLQYPTTRRPAPTTAAPVTPTTAAPATTPVPEATTAESAPYPAAGWRPGRAFNLPTEERNAEEPAATYGPPADKYGPPEESTTTVQPEFSDATNDIASDARPEIPTNLQPGFYFIQLPGGGIQKVALLTNAALIEVPVVGPAVETTTNNQQKDIEGEDSAEATTPTPTISSAEHVQPISKTQKAVWPAVSVVAVQPGVVASAKLIQQIQSQPIVGVEPVVYVQPRSYSFSQQFNSW